MLTSKLDFEKTNRRRQFWANGVHGGRAVQRSEAVVARERRRERSGRRHRRGSEAIGDQHKVLIRNARKLDEGNWSPAQTRVVYQLAKARHTRAIGLHQIDSNSHRIEVGRQGEGGLIHPSVLQALKTGPSVRVDGLEPVPRKMGLGTPPGQRRGDEVGERSNAFGLGLRDAGGGEEHRHVASMLDDALAQRTAYGIVLTEAEGIQLRSASDCAKATSQAVVTTGAEAATVPHALARMYAQRELARQRAQRSAQLRR